MAMVPLVGYHGAFLGQNCARGQAHLVQIVCSSGAFSFKIVLVAGAKRGGLEVAVNYSGDVGTRLVKEKHITTAAVYANHFGGSLLVLFLDMLFEINHF